MKLGELLHPSPNLDRAYPMNWIEVKISFSCDNESLAVDLIADIFYGMGAKGVVVDDPYLESVEGWGQDAVPLPDQPAVTGYLPADDQLENRRQILEQALSNLAAVHSMAYKIGYQSMDEEDWAESWKAFFWPTNITPQIVVKPTWRDYTPEPDQTIIEIDPGMAFGTGTHPTTALCVHLLEKYIQPNQTVLDVGTGSGILLIAAAKLGAARLTGVDLDPMAIEVARKNLVQNNIPHDCYELWTGDLIRLVTRTYDLVVANILADVILDLLDHVGSVIKSGGTFICSGIIATSESAVAAKMTACGFRIAEVQKKDDWVAFAGRKESEAG